VERAMVVYNNTELLLGMSHAPRIARDLIMPL
jgi:hypothetical protein